jgi:very-short-patch-repair endonuclease
VVPDCPYIDQNSSEQKMIETESNAVPLDPNFLQGNASVASKLEKARIELLDLSARNRLLNIPRSSKAVRTIEIVDEVSAEIFRILVKENRALTFVAGRASGKQDPNGSEDENDEINDLAQPEDNSINDRGILNRHSDTKLQTKLTSKGLQKRLLNMYVDAKTLEEEQGVNILFLALGTLKWTDPTNAKNVRYAPLILIPVNLERGNAAEQFKLKWRQEDHAPNLSLEAFLDKVHRIKLPEFDLSEDFDPIAYINSVADCIKSKEDWSVAPNDIVLGFFSFAKFLMYRDLDPSAWPDNGLTAIPLIKNLLSDGFRDDVPLISEDAPIDEHILPADLLHIVDCDSSQSLAVHDVRIGRNLVIQGPPGTGKSQTIANIIASAIADGKTVLFVAEKMAALEVVKRRLDQTGVGDACLELHSSKANKRMLIDELKRTSQLGSPRGEFPTTLNTRLHAVREYLNNHATRLHKKHDASGLSPYQVIGQLTRLIQENIHPVDIKFTNPESWSKDDREMREKLIVELAARLMEIGTPENHPWNGIELNSIFPMELERLMKRIGTLTKQLVEIAEDQSNISSLLGLKKPTHLSDLKSISSTANRVANAPELSNSAFCSQIWINENKKISDLINVGFAFEKSSTEIKYLVNPIALNTDVSPIGVAFSKLPSSFDSNAFDRIYQLNLLLPKLIAEATNLRSILGYQGSIDTLSGIQRQVLTAERVSTAPNVSKEVFASVIWENGIEQASELAEAVATLEAIQQELESKIAPSAWQMEFSIARQILAAHGNSLFRFFNSDWRKANALVKSILKSPERTLQNTLEILDRLTIGQKAASIIDSGEKFGQMAFGADWRSARSKSAPLRSLVDWMRSIQGLGAEPRLIAANLPDRSEILLQLERVRKLFNEVQPMMKCTWSDFGGNANELFPDSLNVESTSLQTAEHTFTLISDARNICKTVLKSTPADLNSTLKLIADLTHTQKLALELSQSSHIGIAAFDNSWKGSESDWNFLMNASKWIESNRDIGLIAASQDDRSVPLTLVTIAEEKFAIFLNNLDELFQDLCTDSLKLFSCNQSINLSFEQLQQKFNCWSIHSEQLSKWVSYKERSNKAKALGLEDIVTKLENGDLKPDSALQIFDMIYYEALFADQVKLAPELAQFDGQLHDSQIKEFIELDKKRISTSSLEVVQAHHRKIPQGAVGVGPLGILRGEMARKRGHMPIRQLMLKAAPAIQALKPVLMMSPLSVAQFLPPGQLTFDLLVMDEASQIQPVDALGSIARCRQVVVVGDERQLPPTKFFSKMTGDTDDEQEDGAQVTDIESILGLFSARGLPQRMLRWHYRSKHQSLIAVSNSQFYENKLFIVPSPYTREAGMGLQFRYVPNGIFDSGDTSTNQIEAKVVAEEIIQHAKTNPELSLGVATFSVKQRRAIQDQLELLRRANPDTEGFFQAHPNEPFFVKNLENVQGDERDVIFISVGYAKNKHGIMNMRFGPLSTEGGERRLNVLISRAKRRCEVFASITDEDIDLERAKGKGVFSFKLFLHFARTGNLAISKVSGKEYESVFEIQVANALQARGYHVHPQVGIAGFFIDLAIADVTRPGRYIIGIECDGASYHQSRSARDRDRLRQAVLEDHGWIIHRVWSTDWFQRPVEQLEILISAIEAAKDELDARMETVKKVTRSATIQVVTFEREDTVEIGLAHTSDGSNRYIEASPTRPANSNDLHDTAISVLATLVKEIVEIEGPVHADEVVVRLRNAWGLKRAGSRIQTTIYQAIKAALQAQCIVASGSFLSVPNANISVRDRSDVQSDSLRKPEMLPPQELEIAIIRTVQNNFGATEEEAIQAVSRFLGFKATSTQLRELIQIQITNLLSSSKISRNGNMLIENEVRDMVEENPT